MDHVDEYLARLSALANRCVLEGSSVMEMTAQGTAMGLIAELAEARVQWMTPSDRDRAASYLPTGMFQGINVCLREAVFVVCFEIEAEIELLDIRSRFTRYGPSQNLFAKCPTLINAVRDTELISGKHVEIHRDGMVRISGGWGRVDSLLPPGIALWAAGQFPGAPLFIRLDPHFFSAVRPPERLLEVTVRPPRPGWFMQVALEPHLRDGAHYVLQAPNSGEGKAQDYLDYHLHGIRSLEVFAKREPEGRLSMMIEELSERSGSGLLMGRCLHFDTTAPVGTGADVAQLIHLDLAINVYEKDAASHRRRQRLSDGRVADASVRTHLLRVERVPFASSLEFARQFLRSETLWLEWVGSQCGEPLEFDA